MGRLGEEGESRHNPLRQPTVPGGCLRDRNTGHGMADMNTGILLPGLVLLALAIVAVPLAKRAGLGGPIGYVVAGLIVGPSGLDLFSDPDNIRHVSELGIAMLLFLIGLELKPARLWVMRRGVFGFGGAQVALTAGLVWLTARQFGLPDPTAILIGLGAAMSSTALVLPMLAERQLIGTPAGRHALAILLFQDLAVIPILALLPLFGPQSAGDAVLTEAWPEKLALAAGCIAAIVFGGRYLVRPMFRAADFAKSRELFSATTLLIVIGVAALASYAGLSMSLGAFLAGVLLSNSEYRHEIQADLEPFEGLLLGLFFASIGMSIDVAALWQDPLRILLIVAAVLLLKGLLVYGLARAFGHDSANAVRLAVAIAQVGEFALVLFSAAGSFGLLDPAEGKTLLLISVLSMVAAPMLFALAERWVVLALHAEPARAYDDIEGSAPIIICGFGRFGQIVGRVLRMRGIPFTAMDDNAAQIDVLRRFGAKVYYGDPARHDLLLAAGAEQARILVVAVADVEQSLKIVEVARRRFPHLRIFARARNRRHAHQLMDYGVEHIVRETLHSSLHMTEALLRELGMSEADVQRTVAIFRDHDERMLKDQHAYYDDEGQLIQTALQAAAELDTLFRTDRESRTEAEGGPRR
jgi:glutathione-regulated potassium-efflux system protein KefB